jgi:hypothetical protein
MDGSYGSQIYNGNVILGADTTLTAAQDNDHTNVVDGAISFSGTVDSLAVGLARFASPTNLYYGLTVASNGDTTFGKEVGSSDPLGFLNVTAGGAIHLNGSAINTTGNGNPDPSGGYGSQIYYSDVILGADAALTALRGNGVDPNTDGAVYLNGAVDSSAGDYHGLTLHADGNTILHAVGQNEALGYLNVTAGGNGIHLNGGTMQTTGSGNYDPNNGDAHYYGSQIYNGHVMIGGGVDASLISSLGANGSPGELGANVSNDGAIFFNGLVDTYGSLYGLTTNSGGDTTFNYAVGNSNPLNFLDAAIDGHYGTLHLNGGIINTIGNGDPDNGNYGSQIYNGNVILGDRDAVLTAAWGAEGFPRFPLNSQDGSLTFGGAVDSSAENYYGLITHSDGDTTFNNAVGHTNPLGFLDSTAVTGNIKINNSIATDGSGNTDMLGYYGSQIYLGNVDVGGAILTALRGRSVHGATPFDGSIRFNGTVDSSNSQYLQASTDGGDISFNGAVGGVNPLDYLTVNSGGGNINLYCDTIQTAGTNAHDIVFHGFIPDLTATGNQSYSGKVILGHDMALTSLLGTYDGPAQNGGKITFNNTIESVSGNYYGLTTHSDGDTTFNDKVGHNDALGHLNVTAGGNINFNGGEIDTTGSGNADALNNNSYGSQIYNGPIILGSDTNLYAGWGSHLNANSNDGAITLGGAVDSASFRGLATISKGAITLGAAVGQSNSLGFLVLMANAGAGAINLNGGSIKTSGNGNTDPLFNTYGAQIYYGNVTLGADTVLTSALGSHGSVDSLDASLIPLGTVDSAEGHYYGLTENVGGVTGFLSAVGANHPLGFMNITALVIALNGGTIHTVGNGNADLANGFYGSQIYNGNVTIDSRNSSLTAEKGSGSTSNDGAITLGGTVDSGNQYGLAATSDGNTTFVGGVGRNPLGYLDITAGANININGASLATAGNDNAGLDNGSYGSQIYNGNIILGADTTLTADQGRTQAETSNDGSITFAGTVDSSVGNRYALTTHSYSATTLGDAVGLTDNLSSLNITAAGGSGAINLNGGMIQTSGEGYADGGYYGSQIYNGNVLLGANVSLTASRGTNGWNSTNGIIVFNGTADSATTDFRSLSTDSDGNTTFAGAVGHNHPLSQLSATASTIFINGGEINTAGIPRSVIVIPHHPPGFLDLEYMHGNQSYSGNIVLGNNTMLTASLGTYDGGPQSAGNISFGGRAGPAAIDSSDGNSYGLITNSYSDTAFGDSVGVAGPQSALGYLTANITGTGNIIFSGNHIVKTSGALTWNSTLATDSPLRIEGNDIFMNGDVNSSAAGDAIVLVAANSFNNTALHAVNLTEGGRFLIYSIDPSLNNLGGLKGSSQYSTTLVDGPLPTFSGNGFLYSNAAPPTPPTSGPTPFTGSTSEQAQQQQSFNAIALAPPTASESNGPTAPNAAAPSPASHAQSPVFSIGAGIAAETPTLGGSVSLIAQSAGNGAYQMVFEPEGGNNQGVLVTAPAASGGITGGGAFSGGGDPVEAANGALDSVGGNVYALAVNTTDETGETGTEATHANQAKTEDGHVVLTTNTGCK